MDLWGVIGGATAGCVPLLITWLVNRRKNRIKEDTDLFDLYERLEKKMNRIERDFDALTWSVRQEPYEDAQRIFARAQRRAREHGQ